MPKKRENKPQEQHQTTQSEITNQKQKIQFVIFELAKIRN
jgi:hypothetical protein